MRANQTQRLYNHSPEKLSDGIILTSLKKNKKRKVVDTSAPKTESRDLAEVEKQLE